MYTFYWHMKCIFARPLAQRRHKTKEVVSFISTFYVIDLQTAVSPVVAHIFKVEWDGSGYDPPA